MKTPKTLLAGALLALSAPAAAIDPGNADAALDAIIAREMDEAGMVGVGAAIIVDGKVAWMKGYGQADRERGLPFTPRTVMNIGSISKTFTGVAMLQAVEDGRLDLDAGIGRYLPFKVANPHWPAAAITLRQLATHTSSIADRWPVYSATYHYDGETPEPLGAFLAGYLAPGGKDYAPENFLEGKPGTHREYSNIGAGLAGYVVEQATGQTLGAYAKQRIFAPLGMRDTAWSLAGVDRARHARLYVAQDGLSIPIPLYEGTTYPDGGVRTSVADLSRFFVALLGDGSVDSRRILAKASVAELRRFQFDAANKPDNVDLAEKNSGLFWATKFNTSRVGHGGSDPGLKTEMLANRTGDIGVILFTNTSLGEEGGGHYVAIFRALWARAEQLKASPNPGG